MGSSTVPLDLTLSDPESQIQGHFEGFSIIHYTFRIVNRLSLAVYCQ